MSQNKKRIEKIEGSLTPKQAVILWMQEAHQYRNMSEYVLSLRGQPNTVAPLWHLPDQVKRATRESMKGHHKEVVEAAVRRAVRDVFFLFHLHQQVNAKIMLEQRAWDLIHTVLAERLFRLIQEHDSARHEHYIAERVSMEMPYPLDSQTAATVEAVIQHYVTTWDQIEDEETIEGWLLDHLINRGATQLLYEYYELSDGKYRPKVNEDNEKKVRECFQDEAQFERFRSGEDYSNGLADITDAEFNAHYDRMVTALHDLVDAGHVQAGVSVYLETVPILSLREVPLVKGIWLDRHIVELAEWGALLQAKGYKRQEAGDVNHLALDRLVRGDGVEADQSEGTRLRRQVIRNLEKFSGRTRKIGGRMYIHFEDYYTWHGRKLKGDLRSNIQRGLMTASWNAWVNDSGGEEVVILAGVPVTYLQCYINECPYYICQTGAEDQLRRYKQLLDSLRRGYSKRDHELVQDWKDATEEFLAELYIFYDAVVSISRHYFDGHQVLFPDLVKNLAYVIDGTEKLVGRFNDIFANGTEQRGRMDLEAIRRGTGTGTAQQTTYLVDMAKAEALYQLGEKQAAREFAERYLA